MKKNVVKEKSFDFAVRIVNLYKHLSQEKKEFVLSKQLLRSGTSVGANVEEAIGEFQKLILGQNCQLLIKRREKLPTGYVYCMQANT